MKEEAVYCMVDRKQRVRKGLELGITFKGMHRPYSQSFQNLPKEHQ
jgi:hypothetical protein